MFFALDLYFPLHREKKEQMVIDRIFMGRKKRPWAAVNM